jgi:hypothetical protein
MILVQKKTNDTCFHIHTETDSTWSHAGGVEKNAYPTPQQTQKNIAATKSNCIQLQSCGTLKTANPTQRIKRKKSKNCPLFIGGGRSQQGIRRFLYTKASTKHTF